ncbi:MAG: aminotransferase class I/II-fold pyridoxal phosphate-dependent enzyme [Caldilineaceae bacterium]
MDTSPTDTPPNINEFPDAARTLASLVIHADDPLALEPAIAPPIHQTSTFRAASAADFAAMATEPRHPRYYTRYGNPTLERAEKVIADLEGAEAALVTASGMGAITTTVLALVQAGDHIVAQRNHYMGTTKLLTEILPRFGVTATLVDQTDVNAFAAALRPETKLIMVETPANPTMQLTDLAAVAEMARPRQILTFADNTFASPYNQRPLQLGIDLVMHSATKYLGGHHDLSAGVVAGPKAQLEQIWEAHMVVGAVLGPIDGWLLLRGLRTFAVRVKQQNQSALAIARALEAHPAIEQVHYPGLASHPQYELAQQQMRGFGGVLSFAVRGGYAATQRFISALTIPTQAVSLGGYESLVVHAAAMWEGTLGEAGLVEAGIQPNLVRFAVGLEDEAELIADLHQALAQV